MLHFVIRYRIRTALNSPTFVVGNIVEVHWDDVAENFVVYKYADGTLTSPTTITSGPNLGVDRRDYEPISAARPIPYRFCDGSTLKSFGTNSTFPYSKLITTPNHFSCASGVVCDLAFSDDYRVTPASDLATNDGAISVVATTSNGDIRYSLNPDFDYESGQASGNFPGLYAGDYTVTAKDASGCIAQITVTITIPETYQVHYRLEFTDHYGRPCRTDIEERGYEGAIEEVCGNEDPVVIRYNGDGEIDKFTTVIPSACEMTLMSMVNFQFHDLFSQDERKFKIKHYTDFGNSIGSIPESPSETTAITFNALENWSQFKNFSRYPNWLIDSNPSVTFSSYTVGTPPRVVTTYPIQSATLYTPYNFIEGHEYDFTLNFNADASGQMQLRVVDNFGVTQFSSLKSFTAGSDSVDLNFTANAECKQIYITISNSPLGAKTIEVTGISGSVTSPYIPASPGGPAGLELMWQGFVISSLYQEPYIAPPYPVTITATDGLADLKNYDFADYLDNFYTDDLTNLKAITDILRRTDLNCNFVSGINKFETRMNTEASDDPLAQSKFDPDTFYQGAQPKSAREALDEILRSFGATLKMRRGKYYAYLVEQGVTSIPYREFTYKGVYITNGVFDDVRDINYPVIQSGAKFRNRDQVIEKLPTYGRFYFEHSLIKQPSLIPSYSFEQVDIYEGEDGITLFKNWNVSILNAPGSTYGIKETKSLEGDWNFFFFVYPIPKPNTTGAQTLELLSATQAIEYDATDLFELKFDYATLVNNIGRLNPKWVRVKWVLKVGDFYFDNAINEWTDVKTYNDVYSEKLNNKTEFRTVASFREQPSLIVEPFSLEFIFETEKTYDFVGDISDLKALTTTSWEIGKRVKGLVDGDIYYYILTENRNEESIPQTVLPNDFSGVSNAVGWNLEQNSGSGESQVTYWYLDNVAFRHLPAGAEPPANTTIERTNNRNIRVNFEREYLLNDVDIDNINNSERTYINFFKLLDGSPTQLWERSYRTGQGKLLKLLSDEVYAQYQSSAHKITGSLLCTDEILPTSVLREVNNGNAHFMFMGYELHVKSATVVFDMSQLLNPLGSADFNDDFNEDYDAGFTTGFSLGFNA